MKNQNSRLGHWGYLGVVFDRWNALDSSLRAFLIVAGLFGTAGLVYFDRFDIGGFLGAAIGVIGIWWSTMTTLDGERRHAEDLDVRESQKACLILRDEHRRLAKSFKWIALEFLKDFLLARRAATELGSAGIDHIREMYITVRFLDRALTDAFQNRDAELLIGLALRTSNEIASECYQHVVEIDKEIRDLLADSARWADSTFDDDLGQRISNSLMYFDKALERSIHLFSEGVAPEAQAAPVMFIPYLSDWFIQATATPEAAASLVLPVEIQITI